MEQTRDTPPTVELTWHVWKCDQMNSRDAQEPFGIFLLHALSEAAHRGLGDLKHGVECRCEVDGDVSRARDAGGTEEGLVSGD